MPFDVVHYIDPVAFDWVLSKVGGKAGRRARFIADPVEPLSLPTRSKARAMLRLPEHKKLIMSIGLQDHRKGVDYLIARVCALAARRTGEHRACGQAIRSNQATGD